MERWTDIKKIPTYTYVLNLNKCPNNKVQFYLPFETYNQNSRKQP